MARTFDVGVQMMLRGRAAFSSGLRAAEADLKRFNREATGAARVGSRMGMIGTGMQRFGLGMSRVGASLTRNVTYPIALLGGAAVKMRMDFDLAMKRVQVLSERTGYSMGFLRAHIFKLAHVTAQSPTSLANSLYYAASAGLKQNQVLHVLDQSSKAAGAGMGDSADIALVLVGALNAYRKSGLTATQATNVLTSAIRQGAAEPAEFATGLGAAIGTAAQAGVSFDQLVGAIAAVTNQSVPATRAITGMRFLLQNLIAPSVESTSVLKDYNITTQQLYERLRGPQGLLGTLTWLARTFDLNTSAGRKAWRSIVGGARGAIVANALVGDNVKQVGQVMDHTAWAMKNNADMVGNALGGIADTEAFQLHQALVDLQTQAIKLGGDLLPMAHSVISALSGMAHWFGQLSTKQRDQIVKWGLIAAAAGPVLRILGGITWLAGGAVRGAGRILRGVGWLFGGGKRGGLVGGALPTTTAVMNVTAEVVNIAGGVGGGTGVIPGAGRGVAGEVEAGAETVGGAAGGGFLARNWAKFSKRFPRLAPIVGVGGEILGFAAGPLVFAGLDWASKNVPGGGMYHPKERDQNEVALYRATHGGRLPPGMNAALGKAEFIGPSTTPTSIWDQYEQTRHPPAHPALTPMYSYKGGDLSGSYNPTYAYASSKAAITGLKAYARTAGASFPGLERRVHRLNLGWAAMGSSTHLSIRDVEKLSGALKKLRGRTVTVDADTGPAEAALTTFVSKWASTHITLRTDVQTSSYPGRHAGGPVQAHRPYLVGERGPEMRVFSEPGRIVPNHALRGSAPVVNVVVNESGDYRKTTRAVRRGVEEALARQ